MRGIVRRIVCFTASRSGGLTELADKQLQIRRAAFVERDVDRRGGHRTPLRTGGFPDTGRNMLKVSMSALSAP